MRRKKWFAAVATGVMALGILTSCGEQKDIGRDAALESALADAGVEEANATRLKVSEDTENGKKVYEVQFDAGEKEYEYEIQASDGAVITSSVESISSAQNSSGDTSGQSSQQASQQTTGQTANNSSGTASSSGNTGSTAGNSAAAATAVSWEQAAAIALERVPGATQSDLKMELDYDDGRYVYEGEIIYQQKEYEFEIDANSGSVLGWSEERR